MALLPKPPQPKPIGPAKGGPPPMHTKAPKSIGSLIKAGERTKEGHAEAHHNRVGQSPVPGTPPQKQTIAARAKAENKIITAPGSAADWTRHKRIVEKSPAYQLALKQLAAANPGTHKSVEIKLSGPANKIPTLQKATPVPGGKPAISTTRATSLFVLLTKTANGIIVKTTYGKP